jgi:hypothetical protein
LLERFAGPNASPPEAVFNRLTGWYSSSERPSNKIRSHNLPNKFAKRLIPRFRDAMTTRSSYLAPDHPGMALSNAFPSLPVSGFNPYDVHQQQHPFVEEPTSFDILLGKEKAIFNHSGNRRFRVIINSNLDTYIAAPTKFSKSKLIRQVHADMEISGYRFLRRNDSTGICYEIEKHEAREKVSHALRDRVREQQRPTKSPRKNACCADPPSPTSGVSIKEISPEPDDKEETKLVNQRKHRKKQQQPQPHQQQLPLDIPTLCSDDLALNQPFSREFFEVATLPRDDKNAVVLDEHQRRLSMLTNTDDYHMRVNTKRRLSLLSISDSLSLEDMACFKKDMVITDSATPSKALRRNSIVGMSDGFARHTNSGDHYACTHLEPYSLDDDFELVEMDHDHNFSTQLGGYQEDVDAFHNMPIRDVDRSGFLAHCYRCHFKK